MSSSSSPSSSSSSSSSAPDTLGAQVMIINDFTTGMFSLSLFLSVALPALLLAFRKDPLMRARFIYVLIAEILFKCMYVFITTSSTTSNVLASAWQTCPIWVNNFLQMAFSAVVWNLTATRLILYYRTAQLNTWDLTSTRGLEYKIIHWIGILNAPKAFQRYEDKLELLRDGGSSSKGPLDVIASEQSPYDRHTSMSLSLSTSISKKRSTTTTTTIIPPSSSSSSSSSSSCASFIWRNEVFWWSMKILAWWIFWGGLAVLFTIPACPVPLDTSVYSPTMPIICIASWNYLAASQEALAVILQFAVVMTWVGKSSDSLGLKWELIITQTIYLVMWVTDCLQTIITDPTVYSLRGIYYNIICVQLHVIITALYPLCYLLHRRRQEGRVSFKSVDLPALWQSTTGRAIIVKAVAKCLAAENTLFLAATEGPALDNPSWIEDVYSRFIVESAPFQINIPDELRVRWFTFIHRRNHLDASSPTTTRVVDDVPVADQLIEETRQSIFFLLLDNFGRRIAEDVEMARSVESNSSNV
eukprot:TRINITY_DN7253_c0_g2_i1.p1 TRINITY_DN7253_c0_g2~~TRINITY_DN7253_c0_g2_i1.p1  ORF type:complete len:529 (-),score=123.97 TRINITY_DN7253_c0_g2_i1:49-1635(-)